MTGDAPFHHCLSHDGLPSSSLLPVKHLGNSNKILTIQTIGTGSGVVAATKPDRIVLRFLEVCRRNLGVWSCGLEQLLNVLSRADEAILVGSWETRMQTGMWAVKTVHFQMGVRNQGIRLESIRVTF